MISRQEGSAASYYIYDGGLSVRALTNEAGTVTDTLVFDAFGNEIVKTGSTDNAYGFQGEEKDETGLYYLRARYMDPSTGTFTSMDTYGGSLSDPMSLHKYMFANSNPVMYSDPSGHMTVGELMMSTAIMTIISTAASAVLAGLEYEKTCGYTPDIGDAKQWVSIGLGALKGFIIGGFSVLSLFMVYALAFTAVECLMVAGLCAVVGGILGDDVEYKRRNGNTAWAWAEETLSDGFISAGVCIALAGLSGGGETYDPDYAIRNRESSVGARRYSDYPWYENEGGGTQNVGRRKNKITPNSNATGDHVVYKKDPVTGEITKYTVYKTNPRNPTGFDEKISYHSVGDPHYNPVTMEDLMPHVHDKTAPEKVRAPYLDEIP